MDNSSSSSRHRSKSKGNSASPTASPNRSLSPMRTKRTKARTARNSPTQRPSTTSSTKSKWEEGLQIIDELLVLDSVTFKAMTPKQRKALANVKNLLLGRSTETTTRSRTNSSMAATTGIQHVPRALILEQRKEQKRRAKARILPKNLPRSAPKQQLQMSRPKLSAQRSSCYYILQEYAGVKSTDPLLDDDDDDDDDMTVETTSTPTIPPNTVNLLAQTVSQKARLSEPGKDNFAATYYYAPPEFQNLPLANRQRLAELLSWDSLSSWGTFDIFELDALTQGQPLLFMGWAVLGSPYAQSAMTACHPQKPADAEHTEHRDRPPGYTFVDDWKIPPQKLCNYLRVIQQDYHAANPYHNAIHAADVVQALHSMIQMALQNDTTTTTTTTTNFLQSCPNIQIFAILLSAVVHDVDHPGKNNAFQTKLKTDLAVLYNDSSVLENWHAACAFARMLGVTFEDGIQSTTRAVLTQPNNNNNSECNLLSNATSDEFDAIRSLMIEAVLHTDMTKHFAMVDSVKGMIMQLQTATTTTTTTTASTDGTSKVNQQSNNNNNNNKNSNPMDGWDALMYMLHMSDISNQAKPGPLARIWTDRCLSEFFAQGAQEARLGIPISPNCDQATTGLPESQVGFIKFVVQPAYAVLGDLIPPAKQIVLPHVQANLDHWTKELPAVDLGGMTSDDDDDDLGSVDG